MIANTQPKNSQSVTTSPAEATQPRAQVPPTTGPAIKMDDVEFSYGEKVALEGINLTIERGEVTAFIGPSGCGKSTLLRCFNRMNDKVDGAHISRGRIELDGMDVHSPEVNPVVLRRDVGMVFQKSNPFPRSIYENVAYGLRIAGEQSRDVLDEVVEESLKGAALWDEVKDRLDDSAFGLSGGQQQRLCIARAIAVKPKVLLMDEPCSALDPIATAKVEDLISSLRSKYTIVIVTHNLQQASRVSQVTAFFYLGKLIEVGDTGEMFRNPKESTTEEYLSGRFG